MLGMKVSRVCCQGCGADLKIDESIRFATCNYCGARLEIIRDASTTHSRLLEEIGEKTDRMAGDLKVIRLQNELEQLDREWEQTREGLLVSDNNGHRKEPSAAGSMIGGVVAIVFGIFWMGFAASTGAPGIVPLFGLVFIAFAIFGMVRGASNASQLSNERATMEGRRARLLHEIERAKRES